MSTKGWNSLKPITTPDQMSAPIHWNPMNEDWKIYEERPGLPVPLQFCTALV